MKNQRRFKPYQPNQLFLLPPDMKQWLPEDHLVYFVMDVVSQLDLGAIYRCYDSRKGQPPFDPQMMIALLFYAYCIGLPSSRKIEKATYDRVAFRIFTADQHPDHDTIADFRKRPLKALGGLFVDVLRLCQQVGLVKLGPVSPDGTKVKANALKHKAMSYARLEKKAKELEAEVRRLLTEAQTIDEAEDVEYGQGQRGDALPQNLCFKQDRLRKIKEAMTSLEQQAQAEAEAKREAIRQKELSLEKEGHKRKGKKPKEPTDAPDSKA